MTIKEALSFYSQKLKISSTPIIDIEVILQFVLKKKKTYLYTYPEKKLNRVQEKNLRTLFNKRLKGMPIAYITEHKDFYGLNFLVNKNVLIPRPETEILVEEVLNYLKDNKSNSVADIGVGSGAIIVSLGVNTKNIKLYGTDISSDAIKLAKTNARKHKVLNKIKFLKGNLLSPLKSINPDVIVANLPYIEEKQKLSPKTTDTIGLKYEPKNALYGGSDGLKYYIKLFNQIKDYNFTPKALFFEIGHNQADSIQKLANKSLPNYKIQTKKDLCGLDRYVIITI